MSSNPHGQYTDTALTVAGFDVRRVTHKRSRRRRCPRKNMSNLLAAFHTNVPTAAAAQLGNFPPESNSPSHPPAAGVPAPGGGQGQGGTLPGGGALAHQPVRHCGLMPHC